MNNNDVKVGMLVRIKMYPDKNIGVVIQENMYATTNFRWVVEFSNKLNDIYSSEELVLVTEKQLRKEIDGLQRLLTTSAALSIK